MTRMVGADAVGIASDEKNPRRRFPSSHLVMAALLATLAPLVLLIANRDWFFSPEGFLDPWQYVGFFRLYEDLDYSPEDYKLARLPWILVGYGITRSAPTMAAAYLLHGIFLCALPLTLFGATYALLKRISLAGVLAMCVGFYTHAHGSGGWDYHNTPSGPLYLATLWVAVLPSSLGGGAAALTLAGALAALTAHTNITMVSLFPALIYLHLVASREENGRWPSGRMLFARIGWAFVGALLATAVLGGINWMVGRDFVFFTGLARKVVSFLTGPPAGRPFSESQWVLTSGYLALLAAIFVSGIVSLARGRRATRDENREVPRALIIQFLGVAICAIAGQSLGQPLLDWGDNLVYALNLSAFLAVAGLLWRAWPESLERSWALTTAAAGAALAICLVGSAPGLSRVAALLAPSIVLTGSIVFVAAVAAHLWRPSVAAIWWFVALFAIGNRLVATSPQSYAADDPCKVQPAIYSAIVDAASRLVSIDPVYRRVAIWFDENELISPLPGCPVRLGSMGYSIQSMTSMASVTKPFPMPAVDDVPEQAIRHMQDSDAILTIVSDRPESVRKWEHRLAALGLARRELDRFRVPVLESGFTIHAWAVTSAP